MWDVQLTWPDGRAPQRLPPPADLAGAHERSNIGKRQTQLCRSFLLGVIGCPMIFSVSPSILQTLSCPAPPPPRPPSAV